MMACMALPTVRCWVSGWVASAAGTALVTVVIKLFHPHGTARGLAVLYILPVVLVAIWFGPAFAFVASVLSAIAFDYFFLGSPQHLELSGASDWEAFGAFLATAVMAGLLASRLRRQAESAHRLAAERESLSHVASLVARGPTPAEVLLAIRDELERLVGADVAVLLEQSPSGLHVAAAAGVDPGADSPQPQGRPPQGDPAVLAGTARFGKDTTQVQYDRMFGAAAETIRHFDIRSGVAAPVMVSGRPWGALVLAARSPDLERTVDRHVGAYAELLATAIGNTQDRQELAESRRRIIAASDETRRKIERDLHDGAQQRLVSLALEVHSARHSVPTENETLRQDLTRIADGLIGLLDELREMTRGLHPPVLSEGGLQAALRVLARRSAVPVDLDLRIVERLPDDVEITAYYVASELLANVAKHARATQVRLRAQALDGMLELSVHDDGVGGATVTAGSGLVGVVDRVSANNGTILIQSPIGKGTTVEVVLPCTGDSENGHRSDPVRAP
jgi:signal transduction histidine kinase